MKGRKVSKRIEDFEGQERFVEATLEYFDPGENHNKFWRGYVFVVPDEGAYFLRHWGRATSNGQQMCELFRDRWDAHSAFLQVKESKVNKGYKPESDALTKMGRLL